MSHWLCSLWGRPWKGTWHLTVTVSSWPREPVLSRARTGLWPRPGSLSAGGVADEASPCTPEAEDASKSRHMPGFLSFFFFNFLPLLNSFLLDRTPCFAVSFSRERRCSSGLSWNTRSAQQALSPCSAIFAFPQWIWPFLLSKGLLLSLAWGSLTFLGFKHSFLRTAWLWWEVWRGSWKGLFGELSRVGPGFVVSGAVQPRGLGVMESSRGLFLGSWEGRVGFLWLDVFDIPLPCGYSRIQKAGPNSIWLFTIHKDPFSHHNFPSVHLFGSFKHVCSEWCSTDGKPTLTQTCQPQTIWLLFKQPV